jgi:hypothetical protein
MNYNKYGDVAIKAVVLVNKEGLTPREAWNEAAKEVFINSRSSTEKGCPRTAFLSLCELGLVKGVAKGFYVSSQSNKKYTLAAYKNLWSSQQKLSCGELWNQVSNTTHNSQIDVLFGLFTQGLLTED